MLVVPQRLTRDLRDGLGLVRAIETGTYRGHGARLLAEVFPTVITIEVAPELARAADEAVAAAEAALFDDLNGPEALAALFDFIRKGNAELDRKGGDRAAVERARQAFDRVNSVLDIVPEKTEADAELVRWVEERIVARREARIRRDFAESDRIRDELKARGVVLEDSAGETRWKIS